MPQSPARFIFDPAWMRLESTPENRAYAWAPASPASPASPDSRSESDASEQPPNTLSLITCQRRRSPSDSKRISCSARGGSGKRSASAHLT